MDFVELPRALAVAEAAVAGGADYVEAGTPLIKSEGLDAVRKLREKFPDRTLIADMKVMDAGRIETESAARAGANVVTVCGTAALATIRECVEAGRHYGCDVAVDLLQVQDPVALARRLADLGADVIIVGGAIIKAADPRLAAADIRKAIDTRRPVESKLFRRTAAENIREVLRTVRTANNSQGSHNRPCLDGIRPVIGGAAACGPAVTVRTLPGDFSKPVQAFDIARPGDILVIDAAGRPPAVWGELATESALNKGLAGLICHGAVRDTADIRRLGFPVWTRLISSHAGEAKGHGEINQPIEIAGQRICPGDWIAADDDGVMVLPRDQAAEMANRAADVLEAENRIRAEIRDNHTTLAKVLNLARWEQKGSSPDVG